MPEVKTRRKAPRPLNHEGQVLKGKKCYGCERSLTSSEGQHDKALHFIFRNKKHLALCEDCFRAMITGSDLETAINEIEFSK